MTKRIIEYWVIPPETDAEFVAGMENVLEIHAQPYDPQHPVVMMDEQPVQLIGETRVPIPATKEHPQRVDDEYERKGTASLFMFAEPLAAFRQSTARPQRTKIDWVLEVARLLDTRYAGWKSGNPESTPIPAPAPMNSVSAREMASAAVEIASSSDW